MEASKAIEQILTLGRTSSTYKYAVLRAVVDYVIEHPAQAPCNGFHRIPIIEIARRLLVYYWRPALDGVRQGQGSNQIIPREIVDFSKSEFTIVGIDLSSPSSGLAIGEHVKSAEEIESPLKSLLLTIRKTVIDQPLRYLPNVSNLKVTIFSLLTKDCTYASTYEEHRASAATARVFSGISWLDLLDCESTDLVISARTYEEISEIRYWLSDAIVFRWVRECEGYNSGNVQIATFELAPLGRDYSVTTAIRKLYVNLGITECFYTGKTLSSTWHLDHFLPVCRFPVNHFWNLVPTVDEINSEKSAKLPLLSEGLQQRHANLMKRCFASENKLIDHQLQLTYRHYFQQSVATKDETQLWSLVTQNWERLFSAGIGLWEP